MALARFSYLSSFTKYSKSKCVWPSPWSLEWTKVKCKYVNWKLIFDGNSNVSSTCHHFTDIRISNKMPKVWPWKWRTITEMFHSVLAFNFFQNLNYPATYLYEKGNTLMYTPKHTHRHTHIHTHKHSTKRHTVVPTIGNRGKQICIKFDKL